MDVSREEFNKMVGKEIKRHRLARGYKKLAPFAERIGIKADTYRKYESGTIAISLENAWTIAAALECTLDELVGRDMAEKLNIISSLDFMERDIIAKFRDMDAEGKIATFNNFQYFVVSLEEGGSEEPL